MRKCREATPLIAERSDSDALLYVRQSLRAQRSAPHSAALVDGGLLLFIGRCFRFDFLLSRKVCRKEARLCKIRRCRDLEGAADGGGADASRGLKW